MISENTDPPAINLPRFLRIREAATTTDRRKLLSHAKSKDPAILASVLGNGATSNQLANRIARHVLTFGDQRWVLRQAIAASPVVSPSILTEVMSDEWYIRMALATNRNNRNGRLRRILELLAADNREKFRDIQAVAQNRLKQKKKDTNENGRP